MTADAVRLFAPAKVNLTLHVTGQRADGYHLLDSLVAFADVGDRLTLTPADQISLKVRGPFAEGVPATAQNTVWQAVQKAGVACAIDLEKNLPNGAGIGGGSADAAAILRHFGTPEEAAALGADVPVCLLSRVQRMQGIGDLLTPLPSLPPLAAVLVNPGVHVPTPMVFKALQNRVNPPMPDAIPAFGTAQDLIDWLITMRNDLEAPAQDISPEIKEVLAMLGRLSPIARMSGSGATCFALFSDPARAAAAHRDLQQARPEWWSVACALS